jgi:hypothetical protein
LSLRLTKSSSTLGFTLDLSFDFSFQLRNIFGDISSIRLAVATEFHHRLWPDDARWSFWFLLLGIRQKQRHTNVSADVFGWPMLQV